MTHIAMGGVTTDETPQEACLKELEEEMGLSSNNLVSFGFFREMVNAMNHKLHLFVAEEVYEKNDRKKELTETFRNKRKIHIKEAYKMAIEGDFECAATQMLIIKYYLKNQDKF
jgi:ADP-ribose pyrophosphatase YjhB (NUDIX family)